MHLTGRIATGLFALLAHKTAPDGLFALQHSVFSFTKYASRTVFSEDLRLAPRRWLEIQAEGDLYLEPTPTLQPI